MIERLKAILIKHEALRLKPYRDTEGKLTIGVGRNLDDVGISSDEAMMMLESDMKKAIDASNTFSWYEGLNDTRKVVITSMIFNMGFNRFLTFRKMIAALDSKDYEKAAYEMMNSKWANQVGTRADVLIAMMRNKDL